MLGRDFNEAVVDAVREQTRLLREIRDLLKGLVEEEPAQEVEPAQEEPKEDPMISRCVGCGVHFVEALACLPGAGYADKYFMFKEQGYLCPECVRKRRAANGGR